jgi:hypothetical protein
MTDDAATAEPITASLIEAIAISRDAEREVFGSVDPSERDRPGSGAEWSAKDHQAHLGAWRRRQVEKMTALRTGTPDPGLPAPDVDSSNVIFHAERSDWTWEQVYADAEVTSDLLMGEVAAVRDSGLVDSDLLLTVMGNGPGHDLEHLVVVPGAVGVEDRVLALANALDALIDAGGWPSRPAAYARYNLACFHALGGRLDTARGLLRRALPEQEELRELAPKDDDLLALRDELPNLVG